MSKCLNEISYEEIIESCLSDLCNEHIAECAHQNGLKFDFVGELSRDDETFCIEDFKKGFDVDDFISEVLQENKDFREKICDLVENF